MKNLSLLFVAFLLLPFDTFAQAPDTLWTKTFGGPGDDYGNFVQQTTDGGHIIIGSSLIKTNSEGIEMWSKNIQGNCVQQTSDGGYVITGGTDDIFNGNLSLIKTNSSGGTLWTKSYGDSACERGYSVRQTTDEGYIITGVRNAPNDCWYGGDIWLIKTDSSGDSLWTKTFGDSLNDLGYCVQQTSDGGFILSGKYNSTGLGIRNGIIIKTDNEGDTLWTKSFPEYSDSEIYSIQQTADEGFIMTGWTQAGSNSGGNVWLIKTDSTGNTLWTKTFGGSDHDAGRSVQQPADGGYIIVGNTESITTDLDVYLIKTDALGDTLWTKTYGGSEGDGGNSVHQTSDGGYIIVGSTNSFGAGGSDIWLIKIAPELTGGWTLQQSGTTAKLESVSFTDANTGTAVGYDGTILRTTNGGVIWGSQSSGTTNILWDVYFTDVSTGTVVGEDGTIIRTTDGGLTWENQSSDVSSSLRGVCFTDASTGIVVGTDGTILRTFDGGTTWDSLSSNTTNSLMDVFFTDANTGTAVGWEGTILHTADGGTTWMSQSSGTDNQLWGVSFTDANTGTTVGSDGIILQTTDGGATWDSISSGTSNRFFDVFFADANTGTAVAGMGHGGQAHGEILRTTDGGETWMAQLNDYPSGLHGVSFTDANTGTVVGADGKILHTTTGGVTWVEENPRIDGQIPKHCILQQNYPNPFNPTTKIRYSVPQSSSVVIKVFDILGREIETLVNEEKATGTYELTWYAANLSSGIYFYQLQVVNSETSSGQGYVETKKMILIK